MLVTLRQLQYILAVHETGSFSKAADLCGAEQSTVSHQVKTMEDRVGIEIFNRDKLPIVPTTEGLIFLSKAKEVIEKVDELVRPFKDPKGQRNAKPVSVVK